MLLCSSAASQAQVTTLSPDFRDIVRKIRKDKRIVTDSLKQAADTTAALRKDTVAGKPATESLPCKAVKGALSVYCQQYRLQKGEDAFNRDTLDYYGVSYTLLVKSGAKGLYVPADAMQPWLYDAEYHKDNASGEYTPILHNAYSRRLTEEHFAAELPCTVQQPVERNLSFRSPDIDSLGVAGLDEDLTEGMKQGYMVWAVADRMDTTMTVTLKDVPMAVNARNCGMLPMEQLPADAYNIVGGLYVVPKYSEGGDVRFLLVGVAVRTAADAWSLHLLTTNQSAASNIVAVKQEQPTDEDQKTADNKASKKKKQKKEKKSKKEKK